MNTVNPFATLEQLQSRIGDLARQRELLSIQRRSFDSFNVFGKSQEELTSLAAEIAVLQANIMRVDRQLRESQKQFAEWEGDK